MISATAIHMCLFSNNQILKPKLCPFISSDLNYLEFLMEKIRKTVVWNFVNLLVSTCNIWTLHIIYRSIHTYFSYNFCIQVSKAPRSKVSWLFLENLLLKWQLSKRNLNQRIKLALLEFHDIKNKVAILVELGTTHLIQIIS